MGQCFQVVHAEQRSDFYRLRIPAVDAVISGFIHKNDLMSVVSRRLKLRQGQNGPVSPGSRVGLYLASGTPVKVVATKDGATKVQLPKGDLEGKGWLSSRDISKTARRHDASPSRGAKLWTSGSAQLLDRPHGQPIATLSAASEFAPVVRVGKPRQQHELVAYRGQFATAIGWIQRDQTKRRGHRQSASQIGIGTSLDTRFWVEAGMPIHSHPNGPIVGLFTRDTEVPGFPLKNGWIHLPLFTEAGTINVWAPIESKHTMLSVP